jgi:hypothetical protein
MNMQMRNRYHDSSDRLIDKEISAATAAADVIREQQADLEKIMVKEPESDSARPKETFVGGLLRLTQRILVELQSRGRDPLADLFESFYEGLKPKIDHEAVAQEIKDLEKYFNDRLGNAVGPISGNERGLIDEIELAIRCYWSNTDDLHYFRIRHAVSKYYAWLDRKLAKKERYVLFLYRLKCGVYTIRDTRKLLRCILRFRWRTLIGEDDLTDKIPMFFNQQFYQLRSIQHEYRKYQTCI